jgi:KGK domain
MNDRFEPLNSGEVVSVQHDKQVLSGHRTFRVGELNDAIKAHLEQSIAGWSEEKNGWFTQEGIDCEALRFGSNGWQKGRIRLCLEFCPDDASISANTMMGASVPAAISSAPAIVESAPPKEHTSIDLDPVAHADVRTNSIGDGAAAPHDNLEAVAIPAIGIAAVGAVGAGIAAATIGTEATAQPTTDRAEDIQTPPIADVVLEPDEHLHTANALHMESLDEEITFDFGSPDNRGKIGANAMMELDLTDLGLDLSDRDLLDFEGQGLPDGSHEFINLQDIDDRPDNSGMLIDEVWNEMSQPNWPGIN